MGKQDHFGLREHTRLKKTVRFDFEKDSKTATKLPPTGNKEHNQQPPQMNGDNEFDPVETVSHSTNDVGELINRSIVKDASPPAVKVAVPSKLTDLSNDTNWMLKFEFAVSDWVREQSQDVILARIKFLVAEHKEGDLPQGIYK